MTLHLHYLHLAVPLALALVASIYDLRSGEIPHWIAPVLLAWAVLATALNLHEVTWLSLLGGLAIAGGLSFLLYAIGGLGAGDVKLLAAIGAAMGHQSILVVLVWIALAGGLLSLIAMMRGKKAIAYAPAIALGLGFFACSGGELLNAIIP